MSFRIIHGQKVFGLEVDAATRCAHYHTDFDIIALKFWCCQRYYPCNQCHETIADHTPIPWPQVHFDQSAILCGACGAELTVDEYLSANSRCPHCQAAFNPGCKAHADLYFESVSESDVA